MKRLTSPSAGSRAASVLKLYEGGFGQATASESLNRINGAPANLIGQPNGVASLNNSSRFPIAQVPVNYIGSVNIEGTLKIVKGTSEQYKITNFDSFTNYVVSCNLGTVSRTNNIITLTAPSTTGVITLNVNGRLIEITIVDFKPNTPTLLASDFTSTGITVGLRLQGSTFGINGTVESHLKTNWQVATDAAFTNIVKDIVEDQVNLTYIEFDNLRRLTTYHLRCRYKSTSGLLSEWSPAYNFTTRASYYPCSEQAKLVASDRVASDYFGTSVAVSDDGSRVIIGAYGQDRTGTNLGAAYVFVRSATSWSQEAKLMHSTPAANDQLGWSVAFDSTGTRAAVGCPFRENGANVDSGAVYIFTRTGTTWNQEAAIFSNTINTYANAKFGLSVDLDSTGTRLVIGSPNADATPVTDNGLAYIYLRSGTTWGHETTIVANDRLTDDYAGFDVAIDSTGTRICFGAYGADIGGATTVGAVYVFIRSGTTWTQEAKLAALDRETCDSLGYSVDMDSTGTRIIAGAYNEDIDGLTNNGAAYIFVRSGTTWTEEFKILAYDRISSSWFGSSVAITNAGDRVVIGAFSMTVDGKAGAGQIYVYTRDGVFWAPDGPIKSSDLLANDNFGYDVDIDANGTRLVVGAPYADVSSVLNTGAAYIYV